MTGEEKRKSQSENYKWEKRRKKKQKGKNKNEEVKPINYAAWVTEKKNDEFEKYYKMQQILPENEWEEFMTSLQTPLPSSFRIIDETLHTRYILKFVQNIQKASEEISSSCPLSSLNLRQIEWYPNQLAFEIKTTRAILRKHPEFQNFHDFLVRQSESGTIFRQETVSMIPILFLNVTSDSYVLDMCSAPGSKTAQILEEMHRQANVHKNGLKALRGVVVANDLNCDRGHMLLHRLKHLNSPSIIVTAHAAQSFPFIFNKNTMKRIMFDSILCDVPCSSDGTLRKAESIWRTWCSSAAIGFHRLQLQILKRGIRLCKVGGRIVYSTCSFNPLENEAVVAAILEKCKGSLELLDMSDKLQQLKRRPGLQTWKVLWKNKWYNSYEEYMQNRQVESKQKVHDTMFPPKEKSYAYSQLHKCMRFFPHDLDAGGFFVAVFEKKDFCCFEYDNKLNKKSNHENGEEEIAEKREDAKNFSDEEEENAKVENTEGNEDNRKTVNSQDNLKETKKGNLILTLGSKDNENKNTVMGSNDIKNREESTTKQLSFDDQLKNVCSTAKLSSKEELIKNGKINHIEGNDCVRRGAKLCNKTQNDFLCLEDLKDCNGLKIWKELSLLYNINIKGEVTGMKNADQSIRQGTKKDLLDIKQEENSENKDSCSNEHENTSENDCEDSIIKYFFIKLPIIDYDKPKKLWLCTKGVNEFLTGVGMTPYKVLNIGCIAFELACKTKYRISHGGATLLMRYMNLDNYKKEFLHNNSKEEINQLNTDYNSNCTGTEKCCKNNVICENFSTTIGNNEVCIHNANKISIFSNAQNIIVHPTDETFFLKKKNVRHQTTEEIMNEEGNEINLIEADRNKQLFIQGCLMHKVSPSTLLELIALNESPPRVNIDVISLKAQKELSSLVNDSPNLLVAPIIYHDYVPVPCWKGTKNVELMIQSSSRYALKCLLDDTISNETEQKQITRQNSVNDVTK